MREILDTAEKIVDYAASIGLEVTAEESQLIVDYIIEGNDYSIELDEDGVLYLVDDADYFRDEPCVFSDVVEMLTKNNADLLGCALDDCKNCESELHYKILAQRISDEEMISNLWKRLYNNLVCA